ncbi:hypothetical protein, partial [Salmonella sp. s54395]|uniref:hypothetical protein n=1 Tax=Salmonella sp. s54395 TaxID=3159664 RepID=UPI003980AB41
RVEADKDGTKESSDDDSYGGDDHGDMRVEAEEDGTKESSDDGSYGGDDQSSVYSDISESDDDTRSSESSEGMSSDQNKTSIPLEELAFNGLCRGSQQLSWQK